ncbi:MAG: hypothetical protein M1136_00965 [Chloroflexi bacterium]|nr:hypothetical protein [Chloroflexota bacterium]
MTIEGRRSFDTSVFASFSPGVEGTPQPSIARAELYSFDSTNWVAEVRLMGSRPTRIAGVKVNKGLVSAQVAAATMCAVLFFDPQNPNDALVIAVWG